MISFFYKQKNHQTLSKYSTDKTYIQFPKNGKEMWDMEKANILHNSSTQNNKCFHKFYSISYLLYNFDRWKPGYWAKEILEQAFQLSQVWQGYQGDWYFYYQIPTYLKNSKPHG